MYRSLLAILTGLFLSLALFGCHDSTHAAIGVAPPDALWWVDYQPTSPVEPFDFETWEDPADVGWLVGCAAHHSCPTQYCGGYCNSTLVHNTCSEHAPPGWFEANNPEAVALP